MKIYRPNGRCNMVGRQVRQLRKRLNLSQEELAARVQVSGLDLTQKAISRIETGDRIVADYELPYLAEALHVELVDLFAALPDDAPA